MRNIYDIDTPWKESEVLGTPEQALNEERAKREAACWLEQNAAAIHHYNETVEQHGCFGDDFRAF